MYKQVAGQAKPKARVDVEGWQHRAYVGIPEAALILARSKTVIWERVYAGDIPSIKDTGRRLIPVPALLAYIATKNAEAGVYAAA